MSPPPQPHAPPKTGDSLREKAMLAFVGFLLTGVLGAVVTGWIQQRGWDWQNQVAKVDRDTQNALGAYQERVRSDRHPLARDPSDGARDRTRAFAVETKDKMKLVWPLPCNAYALGGSVGVDPSSAGLVLEVVNHCASLVKNAIEKTVDAEAATPPKLDAAARNGDDPPEVAIQRGPVPTRLDGAAAGGPTWQIAGGRFLLRVPDIARFLLTGGSEIVFETENDAPPEEVAIFLLGTVFGILLHQRERIALHASAVQVDGKAVLFCGPSGAGKSTLAAALAQRGYPLVTDDFCTLTAAASGAPLVHPDGRQMKLWAQAIDLPRRG